MPGGVDGGATIARMKNEHVERIFLMGPTGCGKTTVGATLADLLGWSFVDIDEVITRASGKSIADIFAHEGEARFRELESTALQRVAGDAHVVVATGGGVGERPDNLARLHAAGWVVALDAAPETTLRRLMLAARASGIPIDHARPMLAGGAPLARLRTLYDRRLAWYADADERVPTDTITADLAAARIVAGLIMRDMLPTEGITEQVRHVETANGGGYDAIVAWGGLKTIGDYLAPLRLPQRLYIVADATVAALYAPFISESLRGAGFAPELLMVPSGEASKSREQLARIHDWLIERRAERGEAIVALGGGVIGDLAGFAAAIYLRGVPLIQAPTSLLAQVDASIGGKVAIDHPRGKNLIGAFHQPRMVLADPSVLLTLPPRQRIEGWAEVIKHGVALDGAYFERLEREADDLFMLNPAAVTDVVAGSVTLKAGVVEGDERESEGGRRHLLNYGHTIAHAIEAVAGYGSWLHGEAVAAGMVAEARLGARLGITPPEVVERQEELLVRFELPTDLEGISAPALLRAALWDKKVRGGKVRWVLPTGLGSATLVSDIAEDDVRAALLKSGAVDDEPPPVRR